MLEISLFQIILYSLGPLLLWTADFEQVPHTVLYAWCSLYNYNSMSTLLAIEPPTAQWLEYPKVDLRGS